MEDALMAVCWLVTAGHLQHSCRQFCRHNAGGGPLMEGILGLTGFSRSRYVSSGEVAITGIDRYKWRKPESVELSSSTIGTLDSRNNMKSSVVLSYGQ